VDPWDAIGEFGADAVRYYFLSVSNPWLPKRHDPKAIAEVRRKFFGTLLATYRFFELYANIEGWTPERSPAASERPLLDRWLLSRLDGLVSDCRADLDGFNVTHAIRRIGEYVVDDLSNWYVRRSRARFWGTRAATRETMEAAFGTLWEALVTVCRLLAPMVPFVSDWMHRELTGGTSVHLQRYPQPDARRDEALEVAMALGKQLAGMGRAAREAAGIRVRQPLRRLLAVVPEGQAARLGEDVLGIVRDELNVKELGFVASRTELTGLVVHSEAGLVVGLDTEVDEELRLEGTARELVNRIQRLRRESGLELDDRIRLGIFGAPEVTSAAEAQREYIASEVLAVEVEISSELPEGGRYQHMREIRLDGREAVIGVQVM